MYRLSNTILSHFLILINFNFLIAIKFNYQTCYDKYTIHQIPMSIKLIDEES